MLNASSPLGLSRLPDFALSSLHPCKKVRLYHLMTKQILDQIEARAAKLGVKLSAVVAEADVDWSTWWRWQQRGTSPTMKKLTQIQVVLDRLEKTQPPRAT